LDEGETFAFAGLGVAVDIDVVDFTKGAENFF
jgi:hypothetical protein